MQRTVTQYLLLRTSWLVTSFLVVPCHKNKLLFQLHNYFVLTKTVPAWIVFTGGIPRVNEALNFFLMSHLLLASSIKGTPSFFYMLTTVFVLGFQSLCSFLLNQTCPAYLHLIML